MIRKRRRSDRKNQKQQQNVEKKNRKKKKNQKKKKNRRKKMSDPNREKMKDQEKRKKSARSDIVIIHRRDHRQNIKEIEDRFVYLQNIYVCIYKKIIKIKILFLKIIVIILWFLF